MNDKIQKLKELSDGLSLLYVEDNIGLCENMEKLLSRVFDQIIIANDGEEGYKKYCHFRPNIVITDINMPIMNGFQMTKKIKALEPECKVIIISAHDEKKHLHLAIKLGISRYLHKPAKIPELIDALLDTALSVIEEDNRRIFLNQIQNMLNYQNNMVVMMYKENFIFPNQRFLEFFDVDDLEEFLQKHTDLDKLLLKHNDFLYTTDFSHWYDTAIQNPEKLFHTKIENHQGEKRHLILKLRNIPEKKEHYILSFDDVTELNLMSLYDDGTTKNDLKAKDKHSVLKLLDVVQKNSSEVKIYNFYRGLSIINPAVITEINDNEATFRISNAQLKIIRINKNMTISSEIFPRSVICKSIKNIDMDTRKVTISEMQFSKKSSVDRKYICLEPEDNHSCTLFYKNIKYSGDTSIVDISEAAVKIKVDFLPLGMIVDTEIRISMSIKLNSRSISVLSDATIFRIDEFDRHYHLVLRYELETKNRQHIREYLANRQMALIREFRKLEFV